MRAWIVGLSLAAGLVGASAPANAALYVTGAAGTLCNGVACTVIAPHPVWGSVGSGASWVGLTNPANASQNTGYGGGYTVVNAVNRNRANATMVVTTTFTASAGDAFALRILADDTATVDLTGPGAFGTQQLFLAYAGQVDPCAPGGTGVAIGCMQADLGTSNLTLTIAGLYTLTVYAFQTNHDVFGVEYAASVTTRVPEPAVWTLMIAAFGALGWMRRRTASTA